MCEELRELQPSLAGLFPISPAYPAVPAGLFSIAPVGAGASNAIALDCHSSTTAAMAPRLRGSASSYLFDHPLQDHFHVKVMDGHMDPSPSASSGFGISEVGSSVPLCLRGGFCLPKHPSTRCFCYLIP